MSKKRTNRSIPLVLTILIALVSAFGALAFAGEHDASAHGSDHRTSASIVNQKQFSFRNDMRKLWEDHVTWTRLAIISLTTDSPDTNATVGRLLQNQTDIGNAIKPFYGDAAGEQLTGLLRSHILIAADLIAAAKAGDSSAVADAQARWTANADDIAVFLSTANPRYWPLGDMKAMLHDHLALTTEEALARLHGDWDADVAAYDEIHVQALSMADMLSTGIIKQFPSRFH